MTSVIKTKMSSAKKSTKVKDVNRPKKASTAYILFSNEMRESVKSKNPTMKSNEIMTELGRLWKQISDADREKYQKMFELERTRYETEMSSYVPPQVKETVTQKSKEKSDLKKPMNAYVIFSQEVRPLVKEREPSLTFGEVTQRLASKWNSMSDSEKDKYNKLSQAQRDVYENAKKSTQSPPVVTPKQVVIAPTPVKKTKAKRKPNVEDVLVDDE